MNHHSLLDPDPARPLPTPTSNPISVDSNKLGAAATSADQASLHAVHEATTAFLKSSASRSPVHPHLLNGMRTATLIASSSTSAPNRSPHRQRPGSSGARAQSIGRLDSVASAAPKGTGSCQLPAPDATEAAAKQSSQPSEAPLDASKHSPSALAQSAIELCERLRRHSQRAAGSDPEQAIAIAMSLTRAFRSPAPSPTLSGLANLLASSANPSWQLPSAFGPTKPAPIDPHSSVLDIIASHMRPRASTARGVLPPMVNSNAGAAPTAAATTATHGSLSSHAAPKPNGPPHAKNIHDIRARPAP